MATFYFVLKLKYVITIEYKYIYNDKIMNKSICL